MEGGREGGRGARDVIHTHSHRHRRLPNRNTGIVENDGGEAGIPQNWQQATNLAQCDEEDDDEVQPRWEVHRRETPEVLQCCTQRLSHTHTRYTFKDIHLHAEAHTNTRKNGHGLNLTRCPVRFGVE